MRRRARPVSIERSSNRRLPSVVCSSGKGARKIGFRAPQRSWKNDGGVPRLLPHRFRRASVWSAGQSTALEFGRDGLIRTKSLSNDASLEHPFSICNLRRKCLDRDILLVESILKSCIVRTVKARTEEFLYFLLWGADRLMRPTFRNLTDSFESWAYRKGFLRQIEELEARKILERKPGGASEAIYRLSDKGRLVALGGRNPPSLHDWA